MSVKHYRRYYLSFIGKVVNIESEGKSLKSILILDIGIEDEVIFYQKDKGNGLRGFIKNRGIHLEETGEEPAFKVSVPLSQESREEAG